MNQVMLAIWRNSQHSGNAMILLLAIAETANPQTLTSSVPLSTLAAKLQVSQRQLQRIISHVVSSGELTSELVLGQPSVFKLNERLLAKAPPTETGISRREQEMARRKLVALGFLEEKRNGSPAKIRFRANESAIIEAIHRQLSPNILQFPSLQANLPETERGNQ